MKAPELLSPAGSLKSLRYAFAYGADAVYAGLPRYSLRVRNNEFSDLATLKQGIDEAHRLGKQFFLACNLIPHSAKLKTFIDDLRPIIALGPDALIMADPGLIMLVREQWPEMPIHLSVQSNTMNSAAVRFWRQIGLTRVILSRELSLDQIEEIRQACPDIQLEVFVHGALCIAYSGRCLLSGYFNHRDANQGACTNSCRWEYKVSDLMQSDAGSGRHPSADEVYLLEEKGRPGQYLPIFEDEHGTYIMNSKDLRAVEHVERLVRLGIDCLKIEGRTKSHYYIARASQVYRQAIDDAVSGRAFRADLLNQLDGLANRGYTDGFYQRHSPQDTQNYQQGVSGSRNQLFVAEIVDHEAATGLARLEVKNKITVGDELELINPKGVQRFRLQAMQDLDGKAMDEAPGGGYQVRIPMPTAPEPMALLTRVL
jgi:putative protease